MEMEWLTQIYFVKSAYNEFGKEENAKISNTFDQFWKLKALPSTKVVGWK